MQDQFTRERRAGSESNSLPWLAADAAAWHSVAVEDVFRRLQTAPSGLNRGEAARRLEHCGPNRLPEAKPTGPLLRFLTQFHNVLIYTLLVASAIALALGEAVDAAVILAVVLLNAVIGFVQEGRAERAIDAIRNMVSPRASVMRDGRRLTIDAADLVPGDVVLLEAGDRVPADLRLVRTRSLRIEEAALTGESVPADKQSAPTDATAALGDRSSMAFSGTFVVAGHGVGVVVATGTGTELGRISEMIGAVESLTTPLLRQMNRFARQLTAAILGVSALVFVFAYFVRDYPLVDAFMAVVGLAVAAIPEGLPAVMTITLAIGVQRMARRNAIIRRLPAVETLGSVSVICSDKTGTLTRNEMMVRSAVTASRMVTVDGAGYEPAGDLFHDGETISAASDAALAELTRAALLCSDASLRESKAGWIIEGDPMEGALIAFAIKAGLDEEAVRREFPRVDEIPFDSQHRFMSTLHHNKVEGAVAYVKGAPERILAMCDSQLGPKGPVKLERDRWHACVDALASRGERVLALAAKRMPRETSELTFTDVESGVMLLGVVGLIDPPREEAMAAIRECGEASIAVKMITGDHASTAAAIGARLGMPHHERVTTGEQLDCMTKAEFDRAVRESAVFARTSPEHKLRIVETLQADGCVVAMTGDGVNDAPALKRADIGISMGRKGTEAAKEASEMVLADDNFASIVAAVREGRTVYDNLRKTITFLLPINGGESSAILIAVLFGLVLPITPVQILWVNMVSSITLALTLAFEPTEPTVMRRSPRPVRGPLLSRFLIWRIALVSALFAIGTFGMFFWALARGLELETSRTIAVNTLIVMEIFYLFSVRYAHTTSITLTGLVGTPAVLIGLASIVIAQLAFTYLPVMQTLFDTRPVSLRDGALVVAVGLVLFVVLEIEKLVGRWLGFGRP